MRKIQFGCGGNRLTGWENYDMEVDITKPLPFENDSVDAILAEHVVEHVTIQEAWNFFEECLRILKSGGVMRIAVPSASKIFNLADQEYFDFIKQNGWGEANLKDSVRSIIFNHGHQTIWEIKSLEAIIQCQGFVLCDSTPEVLENTLHHYKVIGKKINNIETEIVDCYKP